MKKYLQVIIYSILFIIVLSFYIVFSLNISAYISLSSSLVLVFINSILISITLIIWLIKNKLKSKLIFLLGSIYILFSLIYGAICLYYIFSSLNNGILDRTTKYLLNIYNACFSLPMIFISFTNIIIFIIKRNKILDFTISKLFVLYFILFVLASILSLFSYNYIFNNSLYFLLFYCFSLILFPTSILLYAYIKDSFSLKKYSLISLSVFVLILVLLINCITIYTYSGIAEIKDSFFDLICGYSTIIVLVPLFIVSECYFIVSLNIEIISEVLIY